MNELIFIAFVFIGNEMYVQQPRSNKQNRTYNTRSSKSDSKTKQFLIQYEDEEKSNKKTKRTSKNKKQSSSTIATKTT